MGFYKQIPGEKLFRLAGMKIDFPCNRWVKSVPAGRAEFHPGKTGSCNYHLRGFKESGYLKCLS